MIWRFATGPALRRLTLGLILLAGGLAVPAGAQDPSERPEGQAEEQAGEDGKVQPGEGRSFKPISTYPGIPENGVLAFKVRRNDSDFGYHIIEFTTRSDGKLEIKVKIRFQVKVGPFTVFRYEHDNVEVWDDAGVYSIDAETNDNGEEEYLKVRRVDGETMRIDGTLNQDPNAPLSLLPSTYWNIDTVAQSQLLSTENGKILEVTIEDKGPKSIMAKGRQIEARHYVITGTLRMNVWYDAKGQLVKSAFSARDQNIEYILVDRSELDT